MNTKEGRGSKGPSRDELSKFKSLFEQLESDQLSYDFQIPVDYIGIFDKNNKRKKYNKFNYN
jgi:hypothetical protein